MKLLSILFFLVVCISVNIRMSRYVDFLEKSLLTLKAKKTEAQIAEAKWRFAAYEMYKAQAMCATGTEQITAEDYQRFRESVENGRW